MYKYSKGSLSDGFNNFFTTRSEIHDYHTTYKDHYHQTRNARTFSDHSIRTYRPILWNSLDNNVRKSNSRFKIQLILFLIRGQSQITGNITKFKMT